MLVCKKTEWKGGKEVHSNKYWDGKVEQTSPGRWVVTCRWGRIGAKKGQSNRKEFAYEWQANDYLFKKKSEKIGKGYVQVEDHEYNSEVAIARLVGLNNKIVDNFWTIREDRNTWKKVDPDELMNPNVYPGFYVSFHHRKNGETYQFLFAEDGTYSVRLDIPRVISWSVNRNTHQLAHKEEVYTESKLDETHPLYDLAQDVMGALAENM